MSNVPEEALAIGESQMYWSGGYGEAIRKHLARIGYRVTHESRPGYDATHVLGLFNELYVPGKFSLVFTTIGGNHSTPEETVSAIRTIHNKIVKQDGGYLIAVSPPLRTIPEDPEKRRPSDDLPKQRIEDTASNINRFEVAAAVNMLDLPNTLTYGVAQSWPKFQDQPDGTHCEIGCDEIAADILEQARIKGIPV